MAEPTEKEQRLARALCLVIQAEGDLERIQEIAQVALGRIEPTDDPFWLAPKWDYTPHMPPGAYNAIF